MNTVPTAASSPNEIVVTGVFVSNISNTAEPRTVSDFFSFCGKIAKLSLRASPTTSGTQESVVLFETESAAKTALLLTNAMIVDRAIKVEPLLASQAAMPPSAEVASADIKHKAFGGVQDSERSKTSVVASLLAAGYGVGADTLSKAKDYDDKHMVTQSLKQSAATVQARAHEIDEKYKISETAKALSTQVTATVSAVDESLGFSKTVAAGYNAAKNATVAAGTVVAAKAMSNETVASSVKLVSDTATAAKETVTHKVAELTSETKAQIDARKAASAGIVVATPDGKPVNATAPPPSASDAAIADASASTSASASASTSVDANATPQ